MLSPAQLNDLLINYTSTGRHDRTTPLTDGEQAELVAWGWPEDVPLTHWTKPDFVRLGLLRGLSTRLDADAFVAAARACFDNGDASEQRSWCRGVALLPGPERFLDAVTDTCRTNILTLFEAVACENPYPAAYFSELHFNQMVLKAMFNSVALARIVGLPARRNAELTRMSNDYAAERTAAGRTVPPDIDLAR